MIKGKMFKINRNDVLSSSLDLNGKENLIIRHYSNGIKISKS